VGTHGAAGLPEAQQAAEFLEWQYSSMDQKGKLWDELEDLPGFVALRRTILESTRAYAVVANSNSVRGVSEEDMMKRSAVLKMWIRIQEGHDEKTLPGYWGAYVCGVYVAEGPTSGNGTLTFQDPRGPAPPFHSTAWPVSLSVGDIVLFPSFLGHSLATEGGLVTVGFCIKAPKADDYIKLGDPVAPLVHMDVLDMSFGP
jgi:hypothetical protein